MDPASRIHVYSLINIDVYLKSILFYYPKCANRKPQPRTLRLKVFNTSFNNHEKDEDHRKQHNIFSRGYFHSFCKLVCLDKHLGQNQSEKKEMARLLDVVCILFLCGIVHYDRSCINPAFISLSVSGIESFYLFFLVESTSHETRFKLKVIRRFRGSSSTFFV